jgi:type IV pilus assembly protein PilX
MKSVIKQKGAVLIVSLVLLLIMTLLGLSSMNNTILEERMAGNLRNSNLAFQSAESALRAAEDVIFSWNSETEPGGLTGFYSKNDAPADPDTSNGYPWWHDWTEQNWIDNAATYSGTLKHKHSGATLEAPRYVIEQLGAEVSNNRVMGTQSSGSHDAFWPYRITARGVGGDGRSVVMLQSTYLKIF